MASARIIKKESKEIREIRKTLIKAKSRECEGRVMAVIMASFSEEVASDWRSLRKQGAAV